MLRQRDRRFRGDARPLRRSVYHEDERLVERLHQLDRTADGAQIVRARTCRDDDEVGDAHHVRDRGGDRGRRVDEQNVDSKAPKLLDVLLQPLRRGVDEDRRRLFPLVPPIGEAALRIGIDQRDRSGARSLRLDSQMTRQRGPPRPALLRRNSDDPHYLSLPFPAHPTPRIGVSLMLL